MLHEVVFPENVDIPEDVVYATYGLLLVWYRSTILESEFLLLALAGFGISVGADQIAGMVSIPGMYIFEDRGKLAGIVSWVTYLVRVSARTVVAEGDDVRSGDERATHSVATP